MDKLRQLYNFTLRKLFQLVDFTLRIALCIGVARLYEFHWLSKDHILGYLWILNHFRAKGEEVDNLYETMVTKDYTPQRAILLNAYVALTLLIVGRKTGILVQPNRMWDILWQSFWLVILFANLHLPLMFMNKVHWQPYAHNHIHGFFLLFSMNVILNVHIGSRFFRDEGKKIQ